jgi:hypothetical protein
MEKDAKTKYVADGRGCHVQIQGEVTTEDLAADRAHHNGYFRTKQAHQIKTQWTRHALLSTPLAVFRSAN